MAMSSSGYYGVSWHRTQERWFATINHKGKSMYLGTFETAEEAALAFNAKAVELRGPNCPRLNFREPPAVPAGCVAVEMNGGHWSVVDAADYPLVKPWKWTLVRAKTGALYAMTTIDGEKVTMHRLIMDPPDGVEVDHKDRDPLNNRRSTNLRLAAKLDNMANRRKDVRKRPCSSQYKGVCRLKNGSWRANIMREGKPYHLGQYRTEAAAARAYDAAATELFGEFAVLNFPAEETTQLAVG